MCFCVAGFSEHRQPLRSESERLPGSEEGDLQLQLPRGQGLQQANHTGEEQ